MAMAPLEGDLREPLFGNMTRLEAFGLRGRAAVTTPHTDRRS
jgi:hypothetical protein